MRLLLCIDTRTGIINRYADRKRIDRAHMTMPTSANILEVLSELELFRSQGSFVPSNPEPQSA